MKKHGSATKRAFDELMSKSYAGAHRIGKDQNRQGITGHANDHSFPNITEVLRGLPQENLRRPAQNPQNFPSETRSISHTSAPVAPRRRGNIETLSEESLYSEQVSGASHTAPVHAVERPDQSTVKTAPARVATSLATAPANQTKTDVANGVKISPANAHITNPVNQVNLEIRKPAMPHRKAKNESLDTQKRVAAPTRSAGIVDPQPHRATVPMTHTAAHAAHSEKRRPSGKSVVRRVAAGIVAAFAVVCMAVTVYAITSDKKEPAYPDVLIGGGAAKISEILSSVSALSTNSIASETGDMNDIAEALSSVPRDNEKVAESGQSIDSRFTVTFTFYQEESVVCSTPETTVGALMERLGITAGDGKRMYVSSNDIISTDTEIRIDTVEYKTEYGTEAVAFSTEYQDVRTIPRGSTKLYRSGKNGVKTVEYFCEYVNGELVGKETRGESITTAPTAQIMYRGVGGTIGGLSYSYYIDVKATTYTGGGTTASGLPANESVIAVDPSVIPLGTKVYVTGSYGDFGVRTAADTGGSIKGNKIDVYLDRSNPYFGGFGWRNMRVYILG